LYVGYTVDPNRWYQLHSEERGKIQKRLSVTLFGTIMVYLWQAMQIGRIIKKTLLTGLLCFYFLTYKMRKKLAKKYKRFNIRVELKGSRDFESKYLNLPNNP